MGGSSAGVRHVLLADPALFTAPYDAALSAGLEAAGITPRWAARGVRPGERDELGPARRVTTFYGATDGPNRRVGGVWKALKGIEHVAGISTLVRKACAFDLVHLQWAVLPRVDAWGIARIRRKRPVVLTVHDVTPFNGKAVARAQVAGFDRVLAGVDRLIVHTAGGREALIERGIAPAQVAVVPHGVLGALAPRVAGPRKPDARWQFVQFGKIQDYKGTDVLIDALGLLGPTDRARLQVIVAGEPLIDLAPLRARAAALGVEHMLDWRPHRHNDAEVEAVLHEADAFVFPYRAIEASGVLFLVARLRKWIVASDLGAFRGLMGRDGAAGALVPPGDAAALAVALADSIGRSPARDVGAAVPSWAEIGAMTRVVYDDAAAAWRTRAAA